jgi:hypothetical protein
MIVSNALQIAFGLEEIVCFVMALMDCSILLDGIDAKKIVV